MRVRDVPPAPAPMPSWFVEFAKVVAGIRLGERGSVEVVSPQERDRVLETSASREPGGVYERVARRFLADPARRPVAP